MHSLIIYYLQGPPLFSNAPSNTLPPNKTPDKYRLQFQNPQNCTIIGDCSVYVAIDTNRGNDSWLDIYMEGEAEGWVGVGFTKAPHMVSTMNSSQLYTPAELEITV